MKLDHLGLTLDPQQLWMLPNMDAPTPAYLVHKACACIYQLERNRARLLHEMSPADCRPSACGCRDVNGFICRGVCVCVRYSITNSSSMPHTLARGLRRASYGRDTDRPHTLVRFAFGTATRIEHGVGALGAALAVTLCAFHSRRGRSRLAAVRRGRAVATRAGTREITEWNIGIMRWVLARGL